MSNFAHLQPLTLPYIGMHDILTCGLQFMSNFVHLQPLTLPYIGMHNTLTCGLQFMTSAKPTQLARWHCKHCGATNHYPDTTVPFVPTIHRQSLVDKGLLLEENLTPDHTWHPNQISHQKPITITGG